MNISPGPNFASPEWKCPLNSGISKKRFHCIIFYLSVQLRTNTCKTEVLFIFIPIITIIIIMIIIKSFNKDKHITFRY